jgi:plastocyanin
MTRNIEERLQPADAGWLAAAAAMFMLFIGMMYMLFFGPATAWADDGNPNIGIADFKFAPTALTVKPGETVTFENHDSTVHTVVGPGFRSKALDTNDKFSFKFDKPGEYTYFCGLHPYMKGKVVVVAQ